MQSHYTIGNDVLAVTVDRHGAEMHSIRGCDGVEYLWQADPKVWGRHAPILFPIVGQVAGGVYRLGDREYRMGQHGFARDSDFALTAKTATSLELELQSSPSTLLVYPFEFHLRVTYSLVGGELAVRYEVGNRGDRPMPFSIGAHPGFSCAWPDGGAPGTYYLAFETKENAPRYSIENGLLGVRPAGVVCDDRIALSPSLFDDGALIFKDLKSTRIALRNAQSRRQITVGYSGFPHMGIWAVPGASYVCIEPWFGHADPVGFAGDFTVKPGIRILPPGGLFACTHTIAIEA